MTLLDRIADALAGLAALPRLTKATFDNTVHIAETLNRQETRMSELDQSVDALVAEVSALADRVDPDALDQALADLASANEALAAARADDADDDAKIAELTEARDTAQADVDENVSRIRGVTNDIKALGQPEPVEPGDPADPGLPTEPTDPTTPTDPFPPPVDGDPTVTASDR